MFSMNDKASARQVTILLILDLFGTAALTLPRRAAEFASEDAWMVVIGGVVLALIYGFLITSVATLFPQDSFVEFSGKIVTKPIGMALSLLLMAKLMAGVALEVRVFGEILKQTLLPKTPIEVIIISMLLITAYLIRKGYECRARIAEILVVIVFLPLIFVFLLALFNADFTNLLPMFKTPAPKILEGAYYLGFTFGGLEVMLLATMFLVKPKRAPRVTTTAIIVVGFFNVAVTLITLATFGSMETNKQIWPTMQMMQSVNFPGLFIERQDVLMMSFWILSVFAIVNAGLFFISFIATRMLKSSEHYYLVLPFVPILYFISLIPDNIAQTYEWLDFMNRYFGIIFLFPVPLILLMIAKMRKLGDTVE